MSGFASALSYYEEKDGRDEGEEEGVGRLLEEIVERNGSENRNPVDKLVTLQYFSLFTVLTHI